MIKIPCPYCGNTNCLGIEYDTEIHLICGKTGRRITLNALKKSLDEEQVRIKVEKKRKDIYYLD